MNEFNLQYLEHFLAIVRKYMQLRGMNSQKDLAEAVDVGVSTMSRFLNQKSTELNPQLIAKIIAKLNIPLSEIIDFVHETYEQRFKRLVQYYKTELEGGGTTPNEVPLEAKPETPPVEEAPLSGAGGSAERPVVAQVAIKPGGPKRTIHFEPDGQEKTLREKFAALTPRQKAYLTDFLNLDMEGKDLMVDLGNSLFRYFRQKGLEKGMGVT